MSKYIDYDAIDYRNDKLHDKSEEFLNGVIYMAQRIEEAPSIEIVRCKDCKKWTNGDDISGICQWNDYRTLQTWADSFCSFGDRRESGR